MYSSAQFMTLAAQYLKEDVGQDAIDEVSAHLFSQAKEAALNKAQPKGTDDVSSIQKASPSPDMSPSSTAKPTEAPPTPPEQADRVDNRLSKIQMITPWR